MLLPGQLKDTTLGDLLGALFREKADGALELLEPLGRRHRIELRNGRVEKVETEVNGPLLGEILRLSDRAPAPGHQRLGESLLARGLVSPEQLATALYQQNLARLERLFAIQDASIRFRAPRPAHEDPTAAAALDPSEVLGNRARYQSRESTARHPPLYRRDGALQVLGLDASSSEADIRQAFRRLAREHHPDRHPGATAQEQALLKARFAQISRAFHVLSR
jgi:DnaJ-domain-containing protein 1